MKEKQFTCIGHSVPKVDALDKVLGKAIYSEDLSFPDMLYGRVLRAGIPHAIIEEIDVSKAQAMDGVACVLTAKDTPGINRYGIAFQDQSALAEDKVRYVGDPVAILAADSEEVAKDAIKAIRVKYKKLPVVTSPKEGLAEGAPKNSRKREFDPSQQNQKGQRGRGFPASGYYCGKHLSDPCC